MLTEANRSSSDTLMLDKSTGNPRFNGKCTFIFLNCSMTQNLIHMNGCNPEELNLQY